MPRPVTSVTGLAMAHYKWCGGTGRCGERIERRRWRMKRDERVAAVKISSDSRKVAQKFWAPQQDHRPLRDCNRKCGTSPGGRTGASAPTSWLQLKTPPMPAGMRGEKIRGSTLVCHSMGPFPQGRAEGICIPRAPGRTFRAASQGGLQPVTAPLSEKLWHVLFPIVAL